MRTLIAVALVLLFVFVSLPVAQRGSGAPAKAQGPAQQTPDIFAWTRPNFPLGNHLPLGQSATCRFKHSMLAMHFQDRATNDAEARIHYSSDSEDEADTISFTNLDTDSPTVQSSGGQGKLLVAAASAELWVLINRTGLNGPGYLGEPAAEVYTLFKKAGVVVHHGAHMGLAGPAGSLEMGYCN